MSKARKGRRARMPILLALILILIGGGLYAAARIAMPLSQLPARSGMALKDVRTWGYQLQNLRTSRIAAGMDLLVVDYSRDGSDKKAFTARDVEKLRRRRDGSKRIVLAYLSIGEAESYRYYWWRLWRFIGPSWLGRENARWKGNYPVRFWQSGWQRIIMQPDRSALDALLERYMPWRKAYIDKILEAGFDGVYLDRIDVYGEWAGVRNNADRDMERFVAVLSAYAKTRKPGFLVVPQNGEELLRFKNYRRVIDGVAKEDLFYGINGDGRKNAARQVARSLDDLQQAAHGGLPVFVVEYLDDGAQAQRLLVRQEAQDQGIILNFAARALDEPPRLLPPLPPLPLAPGGDGSQTLRPGAMRPMATSDTPVMVPPIKRQRPRPFSVK